MNNYFEEQNLKIERNLTNTNNSVIDEIFEI
jgi:hypothetical protein